MKKALKLIVIILLLTYGIDKIVYIVLNTISDKVMTGQSIGKLNQFLSQKDTLTLISFGTSRSNHHIDVRQLNASSYNMGMDGSAIAYAATLIQTLPEDKAQIVILNIDPNKVFIDDYEPTDIKGLITKYNRNETIKLSIDEAQQNNSLQYVLWSLDYNGKSIGIVKNYISPKYDQTTYYGFDPLVISEEQTEQFKTSLEIDIPYDCDEQQEINPLVWKYINTINTFCKANNKTLIMLSTPTYKPVCKVQYEKLENALRTNGIFYNDYSSFFEQNNSFSYWKDKTHMSSKGAQLFTQYLKQDLEAHNLITKNP